MPYKALIRQVGLGLLSAVLAIAALPGLARGDDSLRNQKQERHLSDARTANSSLNARNLLDKGKTEAEAGRFTQAAALWEQARSQYRQSGDALSEAVSLSYLSFAHLQLGDLPRARAAIRESKTLLEQAPGEPGAAIVRAQMLNTEGSVQLAAGETEAALETWQAAEAAYQRAGDEVGVLGARINQAQAMQSLGHYRRARVTLERIGQELLSQPDSAIKATGLRSLGVALQVVGDFHKSEEILQQSLAIYRQLGSAAGAGAALFSLGNTARARGDVKAAAEFYRQAAAVASPAERIEAQISQLATHAQQQQWEEARALLQPIQEALASSPASRTSVYARVNLAESAMKRDQNGGRVLETRDIGQLLGTAARQAREIGDRRAESYALGELGKLYKLSGQLKEAKDLTGKALLLANGIEAQEIAARWHGQMGEILQLQGDTGGAIAAYTEAVQTFGTLRSDLVAVGAEVQFSFRESVEPVYRQLVSLLLLGEPGQKNLKQAREVIEGLQLAELDNFFRDACLDAKPAQIDQIDPTAAVIYPIILADRLEVILSVPGKPLQNYKTVLPREQVESTLRQLRQALSLSFPKQERLKLYATGYDWLVRPVESQLAESGIKTLVFVPDGPLRNLPVGAFYDGKQYLIEKYSTALTPGLQLLAPRPISGTQLKTLMGGLSESRQGFAALPGVKSEIERVASEVSSKVLLDRDFTTDSLQTALSKTASPVLHLATHGQFSSSAENTFILTWDGKINVGDLGNLLRDRNETGERAIELLVLSACQTAKGDDRAALGLAGLAVKSGARSTMATLWSVKDESTAEMMAEFYKQLNAPGVTKAEALRQAQLALLKQSKYEHPFYWAPFVLVGNWL
ncbi:MAG: CHAT domain-containing protein [Oscillatoria princeps RMCB-10]|nr:CHAT domain-containing protein [Oscillatoria princeps RMCB-10]